MRTARGSAVVAIGACVLVACAPATIRTKQRESLGPPRLVTDPPSQRAMTVSATANEAGLSVQVEATQRCSRYQVRTATRREVRSKDVNDFVVVLEYMFALGIGGVGVVAIADPALVSENLKPRFHIASDQVEVGGYVGAGVGGALLTLAVIDTIRGGTSIRALPDEERRDGVPNLVDCGHEPAVGIKVALDAGSTRARLGATDASGTLTVAWEQIDDALIAAAARGERGRVVAGDDDGGTASDVDLSVAVSVAAKRTLARAIAAGTLEALQAAAAQPMVAAIDPAALAAASEPLYDAAVTARLDAGEFDAARGLADEWARRAPDSVRLAVQRQAIAAFESKGLANIRWEQFATALVAARASDEPNAFTHAEQALVRFEVAAAADPRITDGAKQLAKARTDAAKLRLGKAVRLAAQARELARKNDVAGAAEALDEAERLAPNHRVVAHARARIGARQAEADRRAAREESKRVAAEAKRAAAAEAEIERAAAKLRSEEARTAAAEAKRQAAAEAAERAEANRTEIAAAANAESDATSRRAQARAERAEAKRVAAAERGEAKRVAAAERAEAAAVKRAARNAAIEAKRVAAAQLAASAPDLEPAAASGSRDEGVARTSPTRPGAAVGDVVGLWATPVGDALWLIDLRAGGAGRTAVWQRGGITGSTAAQWGTAGSALTLDIARQRVTGPVSRAGRELMWLGVRWSRL